MISSRHHFLGHGFHLFSREKHADYFGDIELII